MLIVTPRHTQADLKLWREYEAADLVHAKTLQRKIAKAIDDIREFAKQTCYCAVSWGKDSVVIAHLTARADYNIPLGHLLIRATTALNPDCATVRDEYLKITRQRYLEAEGRTSKQHDFGTLAKAVGTARNINGVRADESSDRRLSRIVHGVSTSQTCRPIIDWTAADVMAYLARFNLPVHPAYGMLGGGRYDRERLRVATLGGERGGGIGRREWEQEYYGDVLARMQVR